MVILVFLLVACSDVRGKGGTITTHVKTHTCPDVPGYVVKSDVTTEGQFTARMVMQVVDINLK